MVSLRRLKVMGVTLVAFAALAVPVSPSVASAATPPAATNASVKACGYSSDATYWYYQNCENYRVGVKWYHISPGCSNVPANGSFKMAHSFAYYQGVKYTGC